MIDDLFRRVRGDALARIWIFSDLQQVLPDMAEDCLLRALKDMNSLDAGLSHLWYLGDAMEGKDPERVDAMTRMQVDHLSTLGLPLRFVMGNHDLDCTTPLPPGSTPVLPVWEAFRKVNGWKTTKTPQEFYFTESYGETLTVFLSDHVAADNRWFATQQGVRGEDPASYPWTLADYQRLRDDIASWPGPVILAGHYAFPGGARGAPPDGLLTRLLPLPDNVQLIFHGHSHVGDWAYGKEKTFQNICTVDWHKTPQINVSSLDRTRGSQSRSVVLDIYKNHTLGVFFRDHEDKKWSNSHFIDCHAPRTISEASERHHRRRTNLEETSLGAWRNQHL